jgi:uncharacterized lipoprotein YddW (UPF0748 family)
MQVWSITTPGDVDEALDRLEAGRYDAVFANVLAYGYAYYESSLLEKHPELAPDYDPLAYLIEGAHKRGIEVHAWVVAGPFVYEDSPAPTLIEHPDWAMVGPDGRQTWWLNYTRPDVQEFLGDLVVELVTRYEVDGVHYDYLRYPGPEWGFDPFSAQLAAEEYGLDLDLMRYVDLPAYATFRGNRLARPDTAQVLAAFEDGSPAVLLNHYGAGSVVVLNWDANDRKVAVSSVILDRSIDYLGNGSADVFVFSSETNTAQNRPRDLAEGISWLEDLGRNPVVTSETGLATLGAGSVLVLPQVYAISPQLAGELADFVHRGGGLIFIDGPTPSIDDKDLQAVTGMRGKGGYFDRPSLIEAVQAHDLVPGSERTLKLKEYAALDAQWKAFRQEGINRLLQDIYQRVKSERPDVLMSITISGDQEELAEEYLLDWQAWLDGGYVDLIIPRAYVEEDEPLRPLIADWQPFTKSGRIALGLKTYTVKGSDRIPKSPERMLEEMELAAKGGSRGVVLFDIDRTSPEILDALAGAWSRP